MKVHDTSFVLIGNLPYSVHKFGIQGVYEYDIYISVSSSHSKVSIGATDAQPEMLYIVLLWRTKILEFHIFLISC